jgi:ankyrin repeat protein
LPIDILISIANFLPPEDLFHLLQGYPNLAPILPSNVFKAQDASGNTILHLLASSTLNTFTALLLPKQLRKTLNIANHDGRTALHNAVVALNLEVTAYLIDYGADIQPRDISDETPLHLTCRTNSPISSQILSKLIKAGADPSPTNISGFTPLHEAILSHQPPETIRILIQAGADVNATAGRQRRTLIFYAVRFSIELPSEVLISRGADPNPSCDEDADMDEDKIHEHNSPSQFKFKFKFKFQQPTEQNRGIEILKTLLEAPINLQQRDSDHRTVLLETARVGADEALTLLLKAGANIRAYDFNGQDALCLAASMGHWSTAKKLVEAGASIIHKDLSRMDAVDLAKLNGFEGLAQRLARKEMARPFRMMFGGCRKMRKLRKMGVGERVKSSGSFDDVFWTCRCSIGHPWYW